MRWMVFHPQGFQQIRQLNPICRMHFLLTGFPPFPGRPINPTQQLIEAIQEGRTDASDRHLSTALLPVEYQGVEYVFDKLIRDLRPDVVLSFGVGRHERTLRLESCGVNRDDASLPDNAGETRRETSIIPGGPDAIRCSADLPDLQETLRNAGIPVEISQDAGQYVCNHLLYYASYHEQQGESEYNFLFTHVPTVEGGFDLQATLQGIALMMNWYESKHTKQPDFH